MEASKQETQQAGEGGQPADQAAADQAAVERQAEFDRQAQERAKAEEKARAEAGEQSGSPAVVDPSTGTEGNHQQAATPESSREDAQEGVTQGVVGDQGQWANQQPSAVAGVGGGDPNVPVASSPPPPASLVGRGVPVDPGVASQPSVLERSPQEFGAGGS